jgi:hypothetical protein
MLKLNKSSIPDKPQLSFYAQGMNAQCISFSNITHWSIMKIILIGGRPIYFSLNRHFKALQRLMKIYAGYLRSLRSLRVLRLRELGTRPPRWKCPPTGELYVAG